MKSQSKKKLYYGCAPKGEKIDGSGGGIVGLLQEGGKDEGTRAHDDQYYCARLVVTWYTLLRVCDGDEPSSAIGYFFPLFFSVFFLPFKKEIKNTERIAYLIYNDARCRSSIVLVNYMT